MKKQGRKNAINLRELDQLKQEGKTNKYCADHFKVSQPAISQAMHRLKNNVTKSSILVKQTEVIQNRQLDTVEQLQKINTDANEILDLLMRWNRGDKDAIRVLESQVKRVKWSDKETGEDKEIDIQEIKFKDPRELALKAMAEIRAQLKLQMDIYQMLYDVQAAQEFQQEVMAAIGEVEPDVRDRILSNLQKKRAIYSAIRIN